MAPPPPPPPGGSNGGASPHLQTTLEAFLATLPPHLCAFGYGSALFPSSASSAGDGDGDGDGDGGGDRGDDDYGEAPQIDAIVVVEDSLAWHRENLARNRRHYSGPLVTGGERAIVWSARHIGVGVHFNTDVKFQGRRIKYGVVDAADLCRDLEEWDRFFLAGRLHKPVVTLAMAPPPPAAAAATTAAAAALLQRVASGLAVNRGNAAVAAVLIRSASDEVTSLGSLLGTIANFSYSGDIRMKVGAEARNKVGSIVQSQGAKLTELYTAHLLSACPAERDVSRSLSLSSNLRLSMGDADRRALLARLPAALFGAKRGGGGGGREDGVRAFASLEWGLQARRIAEFIRGRVLSSSTRQAISGFLGTSPSLAVGYVLRKLRK